MKRAPPTVGSLQVRMSDVDEIKSRLDILDVVSRHVHLVHSGRSYKALCPFHTEKTPSFYVFPERQSWRCFGACATGGDLFSFVMRMENLEFTDALKNLAHQAGVTLPERRRDRGEGDPLHLINEAAKDRFCKQLESKAGAGARNYLKGRGITPETIERFQLGLGPGDGHSLGELLTSKGYTREQVALAGVVTGSNADGYRDLFRGRLTIPIRDARGRLAGFGGRSLDNSQPKYLNTPRTPVFDKGNILYALPLATEAILEKGQIVIVEGYMDAIIAHQYGFSNVVASMGTALTQGQVTQVKALLRRSGASTPKEVILALDPDAAGQEATLRSLQDSWNVFQSKPVGQARGTVIYERPETPPLKVVRLPGWNDPADVIAESPEQWAGLVDNAAPLIDYLFDVLSIRFDLSTPEGKGRFAEILGDQIVAIPDPFQQDYYFQRLAAYMGVSEATLQASLGRSRRTGARKSGPRGVGSRGVQTAQAGRGTTGGPQASTTPFTRLDHDPLEEYCLALVLQHPELLHPQESPDQTADQGRLEADQPGTERDPTLDLRLEYFRRVDNREVFTNWLKCSTLDILIDSIDEELQEHLAHLLAKNLPPADRNTREDALKDCIRRLEQRHIRELKKEEGLRLSQATSEQVAEQQQEILRLNERLRSIL